jgi:hypothetical protein
MFEKIPYKKPLIIGTGGGNDIVSATLVLRDLIEHGRSPDLAGICSPGAIHTYKGKEEKAVNIVDKSAKRYIPSKNAVEISFIDGEIPELLKREGLDVRVYNLSGRFGTSKLIQELKDLIERNSYDGIIAVDVGGDILARGKKDPNILSPLMDFTSLYVISQLHIPSILIEFGLQTDGELRPEGCDEILKELKKTNTLLDTIQITPKDNSVKLFKRIYSEISSKRHGHTAHMTLKTFCSDEDIITTYRNRFMVMDRIWYLEFPLTLENKYFKKAFIIDLKKLARTRILAFPYTSNLEQFLKTKRIVDSKTEMDLLYHKTSDTYIWLGLISPQVKGILRKEILSYGIQNLSQHADVALLWRKDLHLIKPMKFKKELLDFVIVGDFEEKIKEAETELKIYLE